MTNQEAIKELSERYELGKREYMNDVPEYVESLGMAISALEENEKLKAEKEMSVKLPCKFDDALFAYCKELGQVLEYGLDSIISDPNGTVYTVSAYSKQMGEYMPECLDERELELSDFGKTIFFTREKALEGMNHEN